MGDWNVTKEALTQWLSKYSLWIVYILIGLGVQIGMDDKTKKLTFWQKVSRYAVSVMAGAIATMFCRAQKWDNIAMLIVPTTTLLGQNIFEIIIRNAPVIIQKFIDLWAKKNEVK